LFSEANETFSELTKLTASNPFYSIFLNYGFINPIIKTDMPIILGIILINYYERDPDWIIDHLKKVLISAFIAPDYIAKFDFFSNVRGGEKLRSNFPTERE
jgi:hypothetical protein